jgi:putative hydrolase of the HAD superfamily
MIDLIAFDADDTLWHNEMLYQGTQDKFKQLLSTQFSQETIDQALYETEMRNIPFFGYGIKSFTLSMIETAIELTGGRITALDIQKILNYAKDMLQAEIRPLEHVTETVAALSHGYSLMIITKGDLLDQQVKLARSGLANYFKYVEIVSDKTQEAYEAILRKYQISPERFIMVGNSLRSDILPVVALGGRAIYIPYHLTWVHETYVEINTGDAGYIELEDIRLLPDTVQKLVSG